jgi:hypothetical protein
MKATKWVAAAILLLGTILALTAARVYLQPPWVQVVGRGVLRTNAPAKLVADVQHAVVDRHRNFIAGPNGTKSDPSSSESGQGWTSGSSKDVVTTKVTPGRMQITDKDGHRLSLERIEASAAPTLIFIEFDAPNGPGLIISELVSELEKQGVTVR